MGRHRARGFKAKEILADEDAFAKQIKKGRLGNLLALLRWATKVDPLVTNGEGRVDSLLKAIGQYHLDHPMRVDHREHWTMVEWARELGWEVSHLETGSGDYRSERVAFERKEGDFSPSVYDRRLARQLTAMREAAEFSFLVITRSWEDVKEDLAKRGVSEEVLIGIVASCCVSGYPPLFIPNGFDATRLMQRIALKADDDRHRLYVPRPSKPEPKGYAVAMIEALPGVGKVMAKKLLKHFGSVRMLTDASEEDLMQVAGIGSTLSQRILEVLN